MSRVFAPAPIQKGNSPGRSPGFRVATANFGEPAAPKNVSSPSFLYQKHNKNTPETPNLIVIFTLGHHYARSVKPLPGKGFNDFFTCCRCQIPEDYGLRIDFPCSTFTSSTQSKLLLQLPPERTSPGNDPAPYLTFACCACHDLLAIANKLLLQLFF